MEKRHMFTRKASSCDKYVFEKLDPYSGTIQDGVPVVECTYNSARVQSAQESVSLDLASNIVIRYFHHFKTPS